MLHLLYPNTFYIHLLYMFYIHMLYTLSCPSVLHTCSRFSQRHHAHTTDFPFANIHRECPIFRSPYFFSKEKWTKNSQKWVKREIAAMSKLVVWASRAWWRSRTLEHLCETEGLDSMCGFTGATIGLGGANAWWYSLQPQLTAIHCNSRNACTTHWDTMGVLHMKEDPLCSTASLNYRQKKRPTIQGTFAEMSPTPKKSPRI